MTYLNLENSLIDERYQVRRRMRHGSYAELFLAFDQQAQTEVVIKALNVELKGTPDQEVERKLIGYFQNEAEVLDALRHPNIITRLGHGTAADIDGRPFHYLVLEYMAGGDLMKLRRTHPLQLKQVLDYCHQVCRGLSHAHERGIIHRDVKPQNLLLTGDLKTVKITDFGIAKVLREEDDDEVTRGIGTETYAPPECFNNHASEVELTPAADVYMLAKTLYVLVTGVSPRHCAQAPITTLPDRWQSQPWANDLLTIIGRATHNDPPCRYATVEEFWRDLSSVAHSTGPLELSEEEEETIIAVKMNQPNFSQPVDREQLRSAVRVEVSIEAPLAPREPPPSTAPAVVAPAAGAPAFSFSLGRRWSRRLFVLGLAASFAAASFGIHSAFSRVQALTGVVTTKNLNLRSGPGENFISRGWIPRGTQITILRLSDDGDWFEVKAVYWDLEQERFVDGRGWVGKAYVRIIQEEKSP
jgi:serine/threonine protein kinase